MSAGVLLLIVLNFSCIGLLPVVFFKKGQFHMLWFATAIPFIVMPILLIAAYSGWLSQSQFPVSQTIRELCAVALSVASVALLFLTVGSHRTRLALWHQQSQPESIVTHGAYSRIRHPFYSSFLLASIAAVVFSPGAATGVCLAYAFLILNYTAAKEERFLAASGYGNDYVEYMKRTGRFLPRLAQERR